MNYIKKLLLLLFAFVFTTCTSQNKTSYYEKCMRSQLHAMDIDFYDRMRDVESKMLKIGALSANDQEGYLKAFKSLITEDDDVWKTYYRTLEETVLNDLDIETVKLPLLSVCSEIQSNERYDLDANALNIQRFFLKKLVYKPYDDTEVLDGLLLFTNFKEESLKLNITYLLLLNLYLKYR